MESGLQQSGGSGRESAHSFTGEIQSRLTSAATGKKVWLRVGTLLDGISTRPLRNAHIVYDKNKILFVGENSPPANLLNPNQREPDLNLPDHTLLPGLIEAHAHFFLEGGELNLDLALGLSEANAGTIAGRRAHAIGKTGATRRRRRA